MLEGVRRLWEAAERREAEVPARGLLDIDEGDAGGSEGFMCGARVVKRRPVERPMTWEKGL